MPETNRLPGRDYAVDNLRSAVVLLVVVYHVIYLFNSQGVLSTIAVQGWPALDTLLYFIYPWFMALLFILTGMSSRYALARCTPGQFARSRLQRLLAPSIGALLLTDWITSVVLNQYVDMFGGQDALIPLPVKYLIYCLTGIGPLWFAHVLLVFSLVLALVCRWDKADHLGRWGEKLTGLPALLALAVPVWLFAQVGNVPVITVYRFGYYGICFLLGYAVFAHEKTQQVLQKAAPVLLPCGIIAGIIYAWYYFGQNYGDFPVLGTPFTCAYAWLMILALVGAARRWANRETGFTRFMRPRSFGVYVLHYPIISVLAWLLATVLALPMGAVYPLLLVLTLAVTFAAYEGISRLPVLRYWLLGVKTKKRQTANSKAQNA